VQIEHYIHQLSKKSESNEKFLNRKYAEQLDQISIKIKIVNPRGVLIIGQDCKKKSNN